MYLAIISAGFEAERKGVSEGSGKVGVGVRRGAALVEGGVGDGRLILSSRKEL